MSKILEEFLALRRAHHEADSAALSPARFDRVDTDAVTAPGPSQQRSGLQPNEPETGNVPQLVPANGAQETQLAAYFIDVLKAHLAARCVNNRQALAEYLAKSVIHRYGDPRYVPWCTGQPVGYRNRSHIPWTAQCPAGHLTDEALWTNQAVGWVCEECRKVYDPRECRIVSRP
jgi:hypothetical protein